MASTEGQSSATPPVVSEMLEQPAVLDLSIGKNSFENVSGDADSVISVAASAEALVDECEEMIVDDDNEFQEVKSRKNKKSV